MLEPFAAVAASRGEHDRAQIYRGHAASLVTAIEEAWDGEWYRRAYFDDGTPLGSAQSQECRIDSIAQSWATICGRGDPERARRALESSERLLVQRDHRLVLLLTPPFDTMTPSPGYIQGYVPGVRENGGQYTHAALWTVLAFAMRGDGDRAEELFRLINPINHTSSIEGIQRYRVEPYVVAADVYSNPTYPGRGGWTWYTGSAGWMYRIGIESILGLTLDRGVLRVDPCIPRAWPGYEATLRRGGSEYHIVVENPDGVNRGVTRVEVNGVERPDRQIPSTQDAGVVHLASRRADVESHWGHETTPNISEPQQFGDRTNTIVYSPASRNTRSTNLRTESSSSTTIPAGLRRSKNCVRRSGLLCATSRWRWSTSAARRCRALRPSR
jgi:cyclic beta-1,2-glucan synthetase